MIFFSARLLTGSIFTLADIFYFSSIGMLYIKTKLVKKVCELKAKKIVKLKGKSWAAVNILAWCYFLSEKGS